MKWYLNFANILALISLVGGFVLLIWGPLEHQEKGWLLIAYTLGIGTKGAGNMVGGALQKRKEPLPVVPPPEPVKQSKKKSKK